MCRIRSPKALAAFLSPVLLLMVGCAGLPYPPHADTLLAPTDRKLIVETAQNALEKGKIGRSAPWSNPETKARGAITPTLTFEKEGRPPCREYRVTLIVQGKTHEAADTACRQVSGAWKSVNHPGLAGARAFERMDYFFTEGRYLYTFPRRYRDPYDYDPYLDDHPRIYHRFRFGFGYRRHR